MAITRLIAPFASMSGKVIANGTQGPTGGVVAMPDTSGRTLLRSYVVPNNPGSVYQTTSRSYLTNISEALQTVSLPQVEAWRAIADSIVRSGRLGLDYRLTWNQLFAQVNTYRLMQGDTIVLDPPALDSANVPAAIESVNSDDGDPSQVLKVTLSEPVTPTTGSLVYFQFTRNLGSTSRLARDNEFQSVTSDPDNVQTRVVTPPQIYNMNCNRLNILSTMRIGARITIISPNGYQVARVVNRNLLVGTITP